MTKKKKEYYIYYSTSKSIAHVEEMTEYKTIKTFNNLKVNKMRYIVKDICSVIRKDIDALDLKNVNVEINNGKSAFDTPNTTLVVSVHDYKFDTHYHWYLSVIIEND